jgi:hypothetical protein
VREIWALARQDVIGIAIWFGAYVNQRQIGKSPTC